MKAPAASPPLAPGPRGNPLLGVLPSLRRDRVEFLMRMAREHGDVVRLPIANRVLHLVRHPDYVKHVLQDNQANYNKQTRGFDQLRILLGDGLLTSEGSFWLRQRRIAQPAFHRQRIAGFASVMTRAADEMLDGWRGYAATGRGFDVAAEMNKVTLRIVGETLLGTDVSRDAATVGDALTFALRFANERMLSVVDLPVTIPTPRNRRFARAKETLDRVVLDMIATRRRDGSHRDDLLAVLMETRDEDTGETMNDRQLRDEVLTMFLAGHETTANALSWTFHLLSRSPHVARELHAELSSVLGGRLPTVADVPALRYTTMVLQEAMRLYPPAWILGRQSQRADQIGGYAIPAQTIVLVSPYVTQRSPSVWDNPEGFDPERFAPEKMAGIARYAYFPFGGGPRQCIGNGFAMLEGQLMLATIAQRYRLDLVPGHRVEPEAMVTLRPRNGLMMTAHAN